MKQLRRWYELLVIGQDPSTLVKPSSIFHHFKMTFKALQAFIPQAVLVVISFGGVIALSFLSTYGKTSAWTNTLIGLVSATGITIAGAQAKLKNSAQALLSRISDDTYTELIAADLVEIPPMPGVSPAKMRSTTISLIRERSLTTATS
jgi:hypothetical protein